MPDTIKTVIVDDEPPARELIREYLTNVDDIEITASFGRPSEAVEFLNREQPDLLFLDIQMPGINGFELLEKLDSIPETIFSTAYDQYAIRAFEINAIDYLLKPYTRERMMEALNRVREKQEPDGQHRERIKHLLAQTKSNERYPRRMFVRVGSKIESVDMHKVIWIKAEGDYSEIHTADRTLLCSTGLGKLEEKLDPDRFMRVHRSYIIAIDKIKNLKPDGGGGFTGVMQDGSTIKVSRSRAGKIKKLLI